MDLKEEPYPSSLLPLCYIYAGNTNEKLNVWDPRNTVGVRGMACLAGAWTLLLVEAAEQGLSVLLMSFA